MSLDIMAMALTIYVILIRGVGGSLLDYVSCVAPSGATAVISVAYNRL